MPQENLVDATFLRFFDAGHRLMATELKYQMNLYIELIGYGWTVEELVVAAKTGYNYSTHGGKRSQWKSCTGAGALTSWLRHWYQSTKAESTGIVFDDFVKQWCELSYDDDSTSLSRMKTYVRARRYKLSHDEADYLVTTKLYFRYGYFYVDLRRRGLDKALVKRFIKTYQRILRRRYVSMSTKYIIEAFKRGASESQLLSAIEGNTVNGLALSLRRAARITD